MFDSAKDGLTRWAMFEDGKEGFKRWAQYMQFKSLTEACLKFELPLGIIFILVTYSSSALIILSRQFILTAFFISVGLWSACFLLFRLGFIGKREKYLKQFGRAAYKIAGFRFILPYAALWWATASMPLWVPGERILRLIPFSILGMVFIAAAVLLVLKTQAVFGMDRLSFTYSYFPREAGLIKSKVFEFIRHPVYTAWICFGIGFFFIRGSLTSLVSVVVNITAICALSKMEEKDILKDFEEDYRAYKKSVPRFLPKRPVAFFAFLFRRVY